MHKLIFVTERCSYAYEGTIHTFFDGFYHLRPVQTMVYKTLGTVIDDLFALVPSTNFCSIKWFICCRIAFASKCHYCIDWVCPTIFYQIYLTIFPSACFRDDVVFLIFLYQVSKQPTWESLMLKSSSAIYLSHRSYPN